MKAIPAFGLDWRIVFVIYGIIGLIATVALYFTKIEEQPLAGKAAGVGECIKLLQGASGVEITHFTSLIDALKVRHDYFDKMGCRLSDHRLEQFYDEPCNITQLNDIVRKALSGQALNELQIRQYKHAFLVEQGRMDAASGWTQQYHYGVIRNNNSRMFHSVGPDTGFDSMAEVTTARALAHFLDELDREGNLLKPSFTASILPVTR